MESHLLGYHWLPSPLFHRSHRTEKGLVLTLGEGDVGQLGLGEDVFERKRPGKIDLPPNVIQIVAGGMHTVCLTEEGEVYTFGCNDDGSLGRDTSEEGSEASPAKVTDLPYKIVQVSAGDSHTAALTEDGKVYAWGNFRDASGSIGLTVEGPQQRPIEINLDSAVVKIVSGSDHLVCLGEDGIIYTLGNAEQGQLGRVAECFASRGGRKGLDFILSPGVVHCKRIRGQGKVVFSDIWAGTYVTFAQIKQSGEIYGWGLNNYYQLGVDDMQNRFVPEKLESFSFSKDWKTIQGGQHHTVAIDGSGKVYTMGRSTYGRLGLGENNHEEKMVPTLVQTLSGKGCVDVAAGGSVSFAVTGKGEIFSWGMGTSKQLGAGDEEEDLWEPTQMQGKQLEDRSALMVSAGGQHTVVLVKNNS
ncbi:regulator of chromosome condensation [Lingula anatina]|uniref:Regulator of chromosome condensation n=1 Tax=Lingula anatina TaxID=7574 RepID=A0A1S3JLU0_LINAN|nr:regulator of chromosome condensation [Lingula anatina]|eukprot:XP_013410879.1 regulator of chromosome condensation [Lingula anatina]